MAAARAALKVVLLWCWLFASIDCGKDAKKPDSSTDLSTVVECVGESWHEDLKSIRPYHGTHLLVWMNTSMLRRASKPTKPSDTSLSDI